MEYLESPYTAKELRSEVFVANSNFLSSLEKEVGGHAVFDHPFVRTHEAIVSTHNELFESPIDIEVEYYDVHITLMDNGFQAVGRERGIMRIGNETISVGFRTSRLFVKENGEYKQLHHHGSFEDVQIQNKILGTLSTLQSA